LAFLENYFDNPFEDYEDKDFTQLPLREKVKVLHQLCEYRLEVKTPYPVTTQGEGESLASALRVQARGKETSLSYQLGR
jgi:hypothetical protein